MTSPVVYQAKSQSHNSSKEVGLPPNRKAMPSHSRSEFTASSSTISGSMNVSTPSDVNHEMPIFQTSAASHPPVLQPGYYPPGGYMYVNSMIYPQGAYGVQVHARNGLDGLPPQRQNSSENLVSLGNSTTVPQHQLTLQPSSPMFAASRPSPSTPRNNRTPLVPLHQQTPNPPSLAALPGSPSVVSPYYNNNNNGRAHNTPGGYRRFHDSSVPSTPSNFTLPPPTQSPYFMTSVNNGPNLVSGPRSTTPPSTSSVMIAPSGAPGFIPRRSNEFLSSPTHFRRSRRDISISAASGVDWESEGTSMTNLYIKGLKNSCTDDDLYEMCKGFGTIHSSKAILDLTTHECKGFGFVMYESVEEAQRALEELIKMGYNVSFAKETFNTRLKNLQDEESTNIYVSNLPIDMDEQGMLSLFSPHTIISTKILRDPTTQQSRGVGFARMDSRQAANAIITEFNGYQLDSGQSLQVRFADSAAQKRFKQNGMLTQPGRGGVSLGFMSPNRTSWRTVDVTNTLENTRISSGNDGTTIDGLGVSVNVVAGGPSTDSIGGNSGSVLNEDNANVGYMAYSGFVPSGVMIAPPGSYAYSMGPQQFSSTSGAHNVPHVMNGAYYYPPPPPQTPNSPVHPAQMIFPQHHPHHPSAYMVPVHPVFPATSSPGLSITAIKQVDPDVSVAADIEPGDYGTEPSSIPKAAENAENVADAGDATTDDLTNDLKGLKV
ncbi:hypothetical protein HK100_003217 [Physocladia obscura]|uniref:RRM domain-containing protein n=1 Tax=Physocladia obscura TaxID=109957 RepID=A0AAD5T7S2_9FUNG|nr:hypothetical protein HK100_003217 [Physocladia obscura]